MRRTRRSLRSVSVEPEVALAWTTHEVRAPLLGVRGALERVLALGSGLGVAERRLLRRSANELDRLSASVESLLALSLSPIVLRLEATDLTRLVREAVATCTVDGGRERVWVRSPVSVPVMADAPRLRAAIANVVRNALAYSPPETSVIIEVRGDDGRARVLVKDAGPGIDPAERNAIFRPFFRGSASRRRFDGLGVGLALAKQMVEAHGGTITARAERSGTVFEIRMREDESR